MKTITIKEIIEDFNFDLFNFTYDMDALPMAIFEERFIDTYWFRNIGFETVDMFLHYLRLEVQRKAPKYTRELRILSDIIIELERGAQTIRTHSSTSTSEDGTDWTDDSTNINMTKELGNIPQLNIDFDNVNNAVKNIIEGRRAENKTGLSSDSGNETIINKDIPLYEAINNIKAINIDIIQDFIESLKDLFSLVYY